MAILDIMRYLEGKDEICRSIKISELPRRDGQSVIVVDGDLLIDHYLLKCIPLIVGGILEFAETIRSFVRAFQNLDLKLVFFFTENSTLLQTREGIRQWCKIRSRRNHYRKQMLEALKNEQPLTLGNITLMQMHDIKCWAISVLREIGCEVFCPLHDRVLHITNYAKTNDCVAILSQSTYFLFFVNLKPLYLSILYFDLELMTTKVYDRESLAIHLHLNKVFFPLLASLLGEDKVPPYVRFVMKRVILQNISRMSDDSRVSLIAAYIRENYDPLNLENIPKLLTKHFRQILKNILKNYSKFKNMFYAKVKSTVYTNSDISTLNNWEKIKIKCRELSYTGKICGRIPFIIEKLLFQQFPLPEDLEELPPCSLVYRNLRRSMYGILLHESVNYVQNLKVSELCIDVAEEADGPVEVSPCPVDPILHPGLLTLWEVADVDEDHTDMKWRLFADTISPGLDHRSLRDLPKSLVVPVAVLYYLYREAPKYSHYYYKFVARWELEVLLKVTLSIPSTNLTFMRTLPNHNPSIRVFRLSNLFIQGCDIMKIVLQSCGLFMGEKESSICWHYDGKLFEHLYFKYLEGSPDLFSSPDTFSEFDSLKRLIFYR